MGNPRHLRHNFQSWKALGWGRTFVLLVSLLYSGTAQAVFEREIQVAQQSYDNGQFELSRKQAADALSHSEITDSQRIVLHRIAGLSAVNLGNDDDARDQFFRMLTLDPDGQLDPFAVPPRAIRLFDKVKVDNRESLAIARQVLVLRAEQAVRAQRAIQLQEEDRRRRSLEAAATAAANSQRRTSIALRFVPFGVPQYAQGRLTWGVVFSVTEAVTALLSIVAYWVIYSMYQPYEFTLNDRLTGNNQPYTVRTSRIPASLQGAYATWSIVKWVTGGAFFAAWGAGIVDAFVNEPRPRAATASQTGGIRIAVVPGPGGLGAGILVSF